MLRHLAVASMAVSLVIVNARVWTGDPRRPWADAVAIDGDRIAAVGSSAEVMKLAAGARVIDAKGAMVVPGFIDTHEHFITGGFRLSSVQLRDARTPAALIARIKAFAATVPKGTWITGGDWDHQNWGGELPSRTWIDSVTPDHPVFVTRLDGHMSVANSAALRAAAVTRRAVGERERLHHLDLPGLGPRAASQLLAEGARRVGHGPQSWEIRDCSSEEKPRSSRRESPDGPFTN